MGYAMAGNIRQKMPPSSTLYVYDIHRPSCERFASEFEGFGNIKIVDSPREAAAPAKVVVSIVPAADHVRDVYMNQEHGVLASPVDVDRLILECSTIDSASARSFSDALRTASVGTYIDTPVSVCLNLTLRSE